MNVAIRVAIQPDEPEIRPVIKELEGFAQASENLVITDRLLLAVQSLFKALDRKDIAAPLGDFRYLAWLILSVRSLKQDGLVPAMRPERGAFQNIKDIVDAINSLSTAIWVPLNLLSKYIAPDSDIVSVALKKSSAARFELDAMQKLLGVSLALREDSLSLNLLRTSLEVGRIGAQFIGYNQTSYLLGIVSGGVGALQVWRNSRKSS